MFQKTLFVLFCLALFACGDKNANSEASGSQGSDALSPAELAKVEEYALPAAELVRKKCESSKPKTMRELSGGMKKFFYQLTSDNKAGLTVFGANSAKISKKEMMTIVDFIQYKDVTCGGERLRYGVGARLFLHVKNTSKGINVSDMGSLAAGVQLNKASVTYSVETIGVTGTKVSAVLPGTGDFNVEAYGKVIRAVDEIQRLAADNVEGVVIDPQLIPIAAN